tara:strand:+ start:11000 stop:11215 length:216 start_codon:yes stop_codon:yes gene_type:complete
MSKNYKITPEQFRDLQHYNRMFEHHADGVSQLCDEERSDIEYGFTLGKLHSNLRDHYLDMSILLTKIVDQQ